MRHHCRRPLMQRLQQLLSIASFPCQQLHGSP
jgi:hypothetical protein